MELVIIYLHFMIKFVGLRKTSFKSCNSLSQLSSIYLYIIYRDPFLSITHT